MPDSDFCGSKDFMSKLFATTSLPSFREETHPADFIWIMACCGATFAVAALLKIDPEFGKK